MIHYIEKNTYFIVDENDNNRVLFSCQLEPDYPNNQVVIRVADEVYAGPLAFLHFKEE